MGIITPLPMPLGVFNLTSDGVRGKWRIRWNARSLFDILDYRAKYLSVILVLSFSVPLVAVL